MNDDLKARVSACFKAREDGVYTAPTRLVIDLCAYIEFLENRNEHMARALKPFAKAGELFPPLKDGDFDMCIYAPAAGREYNIAAEDLRQARHSYQFSQHNPEYAEALPTPKISLQHENNS